jgi:hypothetical protein
MNDYILASGGEAQMAPQKSFGDKMRKCKLAKEEAMDPLWGVLEAANQLRNSRPHLSMDKIADKVAQLKEKYLASLTKEQAVGEKDQTDDYIAQSACATAASCFIARRGAVVMRVFASFKARRIGEMSQTQALASIKPKGNPTSREMIIMAAPT